MGTKKEVEPVPRRQEKVLAYWVIFKGKKRDTNRRYFMSNNYEGWYCTGPPVLRSVPRPHNAAHYKTEREAIEVMESEWEVPDASANSLKAAGFEFVCEVTQTTCLETSA